MFNRCSFITSVDKYQYDKYATSRQFLLAVTKTISTVANVSVIRVNGIRVSELDCVAYYQLSLTMFEDVMIKTHHHDDMTLKLGYLH